MQPLLETWGVLDAVGFWCLGLVCWVCGGKRRSGESPPARRPSNRGICVIDRTPRALFIPYADKTDIKNRNASFSAPKSTLDGVEPPRSARYPGVLDARYWRRRCKASIVFDRSGTK
ncbi:hypothetical protein GGX14DRAFT_466432 [Mycena pura]|uniref:Uncharacterized protein n=1 Tax=Mycena pura TaxID=153505 RepID=A0AAD6V996_9AGAR|nr:hypothetical protein GGX14DRAFT_466432 [Mycena pura]